MRVFTLSLGYAAVVTAAFKLYHWTWGFLAVLAFGLVNEFVIDIYGPERDLFMSSLQDFRLLRRLSP